MVSRGVKGTEMQNEQTRRQPFPEERTEIERRADDQADLSRKPGDRFEEVARDLGRGDRQR